MIITDVKKKLLRSENDDEKSAIYKSHVNSKVDSGQQPIPIQCDINRSKKFSINDKLIA